MDTINLKTIEGNEISVVGQRIGFAENEVEFVDGAKRKFLVSLYFTQAKQYLATIDYQTNHPEEKSGVIAELVDSSTDIESCLFVFEPEEMLPKFEKLSREQQDDLKQLSNRLQSVYEKLANSVLDQLEVYRKQDRTATSRVVLD